MRGCFGGRAFFAGRLLLALWHNPASARPTDIDRRPR